VNAHNILEDFVTLALIQRNIVPVATDPKKKKKKDEKMLILVAFFLQLFLSYHFIYLDLSSWKDRS
jgi:hypothetical protein